MLVFIKKIWLYAFLLIVLLFIVQYLSVELDKLEQLPTLYYSFFFLALISTLLHWFCSSLLWRDLLQLNTQHPVRILDSFLHINLVLLGKYIPGKVWGMLARAAYVTHYHISRPTIILITLQEQALVIHAGVLLSGLLLFALTQTLTSLSIAVLALSALILNQKIQLVGFFLLKKLQYYLPSALQTLPLNTLTTKQYSILFVWSLFIWIFSSTTFVLIYFALGYTAFDFNIFAWLVVANIMGIVGGFFALFAPGGIGVREGIIVSILIQFLPLKEAVLYSLLYRIFLVAIELPLTAFVLLLLRRKQSPLD